MNFPDPLALDQAPDLVLTAAKGFDFEDEDTGPAITPALADHLGHHGALATDADMAAIFIASGKGVVRAVARHGAQSRYRADDRGVAGRHTSWRRRPVARGQLATGAL